MPAWTCEKGRDEGIQAGVLAKSLRASMPDLLADALDGR